LDGLGHSMVLSTRQWGRVTALRAISPQYAGDPNECYLLLLALFCMDCLHCHTKHIILAG
jgi:hypothetical protein